VDPGLAAEAQSWSAQLASAGAVQDPTLAGCGSAPTAEQVCELASNSGNSGNDPWPGDGSDGMESEFMSSPIHRQNMLDAGYDEVGIGVTCSAGQAWTVEIFGYSYGDIGLAQSRQAAQQAVAGDPVPAMPTVAGAQTGDPVYCPGQMVGPNDGTTTTGGQYAYPYAVPSVSGEPQAAPAAVGIAAAAGDQGYWVAKSDGSVSSLGSATDFGSMAGQALAHPMVGIASTPDGGGYWLVGSDGGVFAFGDAGFYGSTPGLGLAPAGTAAGRHLNAPMAGVVPSVDDKGYFMVGSDGGVFAFGDARFEGSCPGIGGCSGSAVAVAPDASGSGYWLVTSTGRIYTFGDAPYFGAPGPQSSAITSMVRTPDGGGYWVLSANGQVFSYGDAAPMGSVSANASDPATAIIATADGGGYWVSSALGAVYAFGDAPYDGGMSGTHLNGTIIGATGF